MINIHQLFTTFCIMLLIFSLYFKLWRKSISTMIFIVASAVLVLDNIDMNLKYIIIMILLFFAVIRAITKPSNEQLFYKRS